MKRTEHPIAPVLRAALEFAAPGASVAVVSSLAPIRVSSTNFKKLELHVDEGLRLYGAHPVMGPWLRALPKDILDPKNSLGRARHGLFRIEMRHCHREAMSNGLVGYAAVAAVGGDAVLVLFVAHSAAQEDIKTGSGEVNAWAEVVTASWEWAAAARCLRFQRDTRMGRSNLVFARIDAAVRSRPGATYFLAEKEIDPHQDSWEAVISSQKSSDESQTAKLSQLAGRLRKLSVGAWPRKSAPVGLRKTRKMDATNTEIEDPNGVLEVDPDQAETLLSVLKAYGTGHAASSIAVERALTGARDLRGVLMLTKLVPLLKGETRAQLPARLEELRAVGVITKGEVRLVQDALALRSTAPLRVIATAAAVGYVEPIISAARHLRSGVFDCLQAGTIPGRRDYLGWTPTFIVADSTYIPKGDEKMYVVEGEIPEDHPFWRCTEARQALIRKCGFWHFEFQCGSPVTLSDEDWFAIEDRVDRNRKEHAKRLASGHSRPLAGLRWTDETSGQHFKLTHGGDKGTYALLGPDVDDTPSHLYTLGSSEAAKELGRVFLDLAERVGATTIPVVPIVASARISPVERRQAMLDQLRFDFGEAKLSLSGYARELARLETDSLAYQAAIEARDIDEKRALALRDVLIPDAETQLHLVEVEETLPRDPLLEEVDGNFALLVATGLGLLRSDPYAPAEIVNAVDWLVDSGHGFSNLRFGKHDRQLLIDVRVRVPIVDGSIEWMEAGTLDLTNRRMHEDRGAQYTDDLARRFLFDREELAALTARYGWTRESILTRMSWWIDRSAGVNWYLRSAVVTAAASGDPTLPVPQVVYAVIVHDEEALASLRSSFGDGIVDRILEAYFGDDASWAHMTGWVRKPLDVWRSAMAAVAANGPVRHTNLIASIGGLTSLEQIQDNLRPGRTPYWQPPLQLNDGWVTLHLCERPSCPRGKGAPMTGFLPVPELVVRGDAVFCVYCWRSPNWDDPIPEAYRRLWDVSAVNASLSRADGIPFVQSSVSESILAPNSLRSRDLARELQVPLHWVQKHAAAGDIPSTKSSSGKLTFDGAVSKSPAVRALLAQRRSETEPPSELPAEGSDVVDAKAAARHLGVEQLTVRHLTGARAITNCGSRDAPKYELSDLDALLASVRSQIGDQTATLAGLRAHNYLASKWDCTTSVVHRMLSAGVLKGVIVGEMTMIDDSAIASMDPRVAAALDPAHRLSLDDVAAKAGLTKGTVLHHMRRGSLPAVQLYPRGRWYFFTEEVEQWLESRRQTQA